MQVNIVLYTKDGSWEIPLTIREPSSELEAMKEIARKLQIEIVKMQKGR